MRRAGYVWQFTQFIVGRLGDVSWGCFAIYTVLGGGVLGMFGSIKIAVAGEGWNVIVFAQLLLTTLLC